MKAAVFLANGFEEIEAIAPIDVLRRAAVEVVTVSLTSDKTVMGAHSIALVADRLFCETDFTDVDVLVLPGGMPGAKNLHEHAALQHLLLHFAEKNRHIAAICAAPAVVLGNLGLLTGKEATCYPGFEAQMNAAKLSSKSVITDGNITTAKAPGVAIDFALELVTLLCGSQTANKVAEGMCITENLLPS